MPLSNKKNRRNLTLAKRAFWENRHDEVIESYIKDHIELHEKLDLDIINFPMATWAIPAPSDDPPPRQVDSNTWEDKYGRVFKLSEITFDIVCVEDPVAQDYLYTMDSEVLASVIWRMARRTSASPSLAPDTSCGAHTNTYRSPGSSSLTEPVP